MLASRNGARRLKKKADVVEHPKAFGHVGLLINEPSGTAGLLFNWSSDDLSDNGSQNSAYRPSFSIR